MKWFLAMVLSIVMMLITSYVRTKFNMNVDDLFYDLIPFISGWWCCAIIENIK
jgi:hypothetical protein